MAVTVGKLDRIAQFLRSEPVFDGYQTRPGPHVPYGAPHPVSRNDISDAEKFASGTVLATLTARFIVRHTTFTAGLTPADWLVCDGGNWTISGIKQLPEPRRQWLEITATRGAN